MIPLVLIFVAQSFEVASIRPSDKHLTASYSRIEPGGKRFTASNATLRLLISTAYSIDPRHVQGGPSWIDGDYFDIHAAAEHPSTPAEIHVMLQTLLAERFALSVHEQTTEAQVYTLTAEHPKLRENKSGAGPRGRRGAEGQTIFEGVSVSQLAWFISVRLRDDVLDETGLAGNYDFEFSWQFDNPDGPSVFTAVHELGLKLTRTKREVRTLIVDRAGRPSLN